MIATDTFDGQQVLTRVGKSGLDPMRSLSRERRLLTSSTSRRIQGDRASARPARTFASKGSTSRIVSPSSASNSVPRMEGNCPGIVFSPGNVLVTHPRKGIAQLRLNDQAIHVLRLCESAPTNARVGLGRFAPSQSIIPRVDWSIHDSLNAFHYPHA